MYSGQYSITVTGNTKSVGITITDTSTNLVKEFTLAGNRDIEGVFRHCHSLTDDQIKMWFSNKNR